MRGRLNALRRRLENVASVLTDVDFLPFLADRKLSRVAMEATKFHDAREKYYGIYLWITENVSHEKADGYRNSLEVFYERKGVCGEQAYLFIAMARAVNLDARYASVFVDYKNKKVSHACVAVSGMLIDTSYGMFSVRHKDYKILTDEEVGENYRRWRFGE